MQFSGEEQFTHEQSHLWERLVDVDFMAKALPGFEQVEKSEPKLVICRIRPGVSRLVSTAKLRLEILDERAPDSVRIRILGKAIGSSVEAEATFELSSIENGTKVSWSGDVTETLGLLKLVKPSRIEEVAQRLISDVYENVRNELDGKSTAVGDVC
jgi:carbon monoxide dehydrogenase subunit G